MHQWKARHKVVRQHALKVHCQAANVQCKQQFELQLAVQEVHDSQQVCCRLCAMHRGLHDCSCRDISNTCVPNPRKIPAALRSPLSHTQDLKMQDKRYTSQTFAQGQLEDAVTRQLMQSASNGCLECTQPGVVM